MPRKSFAELAEEVAAHIPTGGDIEHAALVQNLSAEQVAALPNLVKGKYIVAEVRATGVDTLPAVFYSHKGA